MTEARATPGGPLDAQPAPAPILRVTRPLYWSIRRELWESRSIYLAPLGVAALVLLGFLISAIHLPARMRAAAALDPAKHHEAIQQPYFLAALLLMLATFLVGVFYSLDALNGERRDRSILFWKSMPVSDLTTVLAKACVPIVILPLLTFAITVATQLVILLLSSAILLASGESVATLWDHVPLFQMSALLLHHLVTVHGLWYAPIFCWLLLVSAWARRAAFLWAGLPLLAIGIVERIAFNTSHFGALLANRLSGGEEGGEFTVSSVAMDPLMHVGLGRFLVKPGLWLGLAVAALFLWAAVRLRRYREPN